MDDDEDDDVDVEGDDFLFLAKLLGTGNLVRTYPPLFQGISMPFAPIQQQLSLTRLLLLLLVPPVLRTLLPFVWGS